MARGCHAAHGLARWCHARRDLSPVLMCPTTHTRCRSTPTHGTVSAQRGRTSYGCAAHVGGIVGGRLYRVCTKSALHVSLHNCDLVAPLSCRAALEALSVFWSPTQLITLFALHILSYHSVYLSRIYDCVTEDEVEEEKIEVRRSTKCQVKEATPTASTQ